MAAEKVVADPRNEFHMSTIVELKPTVVEFMLGAAVTVDPDACGDSTNVIPPVRTSVKVS
jgi:hypothetical protein